MPATTSHPQRPKVILVEDDAGLLHALTFSFQVEGFEVEAFRDGEALLAAEIMGQACLVIDYKLPGLNGLEVVHRLRERAVNVPAILITTPNGSVVGAAARADVDLVAKPLLSDRLLDRVRTALSLDAASSEAAFAAF